MEPANVLTTQTKPWPRAVASVVTSTRAGVHAAGQRQGNCVAGVGQKKPARQAGEESAGSDGVPVTDAVGDATVIGDTRSASKTKIIIIILTDATFSLGFPTSTFVQQVAQWKNFDSQSACRSGNFRRRRFSGGDSDSAAT